MKILNILATGGTGGIEVLCKNIASYSNDKNKNYWCFVFGGGEIAYDFLKEYPKETSILGINKLFRKKIVNTISKIIDEENIDIITIHHGGLYSNIIYLDLRKKFKSKKFVRFIHSCYDERFLKKKSYVYIKIYKSILTKALNNSDLVIYVSKAVEKSFTDITSPNINSEVIYNGIGDTFYRSLENTERNNNIIYVGRISKEKGIDILIEAFGIVKKSIPSAKLTIVGDGSQRKELEEKTSNMSDISWTGLKNNVIPYLDSSKVFVYPSICNEAFGISVVESMARGCIPITFSVGGLPEIIENGVNGFIANKIDSKELASSIIDALKSKKQNELSQNARERSYAFSIEKTVENINHAYEKIL